RLRRSPRLARSIVFSFLFLYDRPACLARDDRHRCRARSFISHLARTIFAALLFAARSHGPVLAFRGHRLDFSFSAAVFDWRPLMASAKVVPVRTYVLTFIALLVVLFFMHAFYDKGLTRVAMVLGLLWLTILIVLSSADVFTRNWTPVPHDWGPDISLQQKKK